MNVKLRPITLTASESHWRLFMLRKADPAFLTFQAKIFQRDNHTCQFCGFRGKSHLEAINIDGNYSNNKAANLITACPFCVQCFFLEGVGRSDIGGGTLVYLPEMSQNQLNALVHVLFASIVSGNSYSSDAKNIYRSLRLRSHPVEQALGEGMSNPALYGQLLVDSNSQQGRQLHQQLVDYVRVLPDLSKFAPVIELWAIEALKELI